MTVVPVILVNDMVGSGTETDVGRYLKVTKKE
jgi:hypothetical protein